MKYCLLIVLLMMRLSGYSSDSIVVGSKHTFYSPTLNEKRVYSLSLPASYYNKKYSPVKYPVLYVLDGESSFEYISSIVKFLSKGVYAHIPEMIVVGIHNSNRTKDMTPTKSFIKSPIDSTKTLFDESGGNAAFMQFITAELIPHIDSNYRSTNYRIMAGHSFGGLATTNMMLVHPDTFKAYIIHDPSFWWDNEYMLKEARTIIPKINYKQARVYLSQAENEAKGSFDAHFEDIKLFKKIADSVQNPTLSFKYAFYETEDHGTITLPATYNALKFIFDGFWVDFKKTSLNRDYIIDNYKRFSQKVGYTFHPSEPMLDFIVKDFKEQNKKEEAQAILQQYRFLYPKTAPAL